MFAQQLQAIAAVAVLLQAAADLAPGLPIVSALGLQGRELQTPAQAKVPPVGPAFTAPVLALIQSCHRWGQAVRGRRLSVGH